jgi:hypothetical protein
LEELMAIHLTEKEKKEILDAICGVLAAHRSAPKMGGTTQSDPAMLKTTSSTGGIAEDEIILQLREL